MFKMSENMSWSLYFALIFDLKLLLLGATSLFIMGEYINMHSFRNFLSDISLEKLASHREPGYNSIFVENSKNIVKENFAFSRKLVKLL